MTKTRVYIHDVAKAFRDSGGKPVLLKYQTGANHIVTSDGTRRRENPKDRSQSQKTLRRLHIKEKRLARENVAALDAQQKAAA
jgi:hypothetical protein